MVGLRRGGWEDDRSYARYLLVRGLSFRTKRRPVILSVAKDLKKMGRDAVEHVVDGTKNS